MRKIDLAMLLALWTFTCRASKPNIKFCGLDVQTETASKFLIAVADYERSPNCVVRFTKPSHFYDAPCFESQFTLTSDIEIYQRFKFRAGWLKNCFL